MTALVTEDQATSKPKAIYDEIEQDFGMVPNFFLAQGAVDPE